MNREQAIELARRFAKAKPESYYSEPFRPHEWVIDAIVAANLKGYYESQCTCSSNPCEPADDRCPVHNPK
jgi:hypothetical protein